MATIYICKCGRQVRKSTNADNTGNRDTTGCKGCPYLLPWGPMEWTGKSFEQNVKGHECRMSPEISYATDYSGSADDKCTLKIHSLDLDFLEDIQAWIDEYADGQLSGRFSRDTIRGTDYCNKGRYSWSISCAQNKKGMAAKAALIERFFDPDGHRLDMTPEEEKAHILAAIEAGKAKASGKEKDMQVYTNQYGTLFAVREHNGSPALMCKAKESEQWVMSGILAAVKDDAKTIGELQAVLDKAAQEYGWKPVEGDAQFENPTYSAAATAAAEETAAAPEPSDSASMTAATAANTCAQEGTANENTGAANEDNAPDVCPYLELIENSRKYNCQCSICGDRFVNTEFCNKSFRGCGWYLGQQDKTGLPDDDENELIDKSDCLCRTCGRESCFAHSCAKECPANADESCLTVSCPEYIERTDTTCECKKIFAPNGDAAATSDGSAARMCEGPGEETRTTQAAASGAAPESLHAQSALPQNAPAQDIAADAPSALGFDFSALGDMAEQAAEADAQFDLHYGRAQDEYLAACIYMARIHALTAKAGRYGGGTWTAWYQSKGISEGSARTMVQNGDGFKSATAADLKKLPELTRKDLNLIARNGAANQVVEAAGEGDSDRIQDILNQLKAVQTERDEARKAKEKTEQERDAAEARAKKAEQDVEYFKKDSEDARKATHTYHCKYDEANAQRNALLDEQGTYAFQITAAELRAEEAERRARAAEEDAAGWKQAGLEMQELVDQRDERIRELESGITVEAAAVDQEEIERRANELSEPLVKIIDQQNEQIERMASGNTVAAQASVLEHYLKTMEASLMSNARRAEPACYDVRALDSLAQALRAFADEIDGLFEEGEENEE